MLVICKFLRMEPRMSRLPRDFTSLLDHRLGWMMFPYSAEPLRAGNVAIQARPFSQVAQSDPREITLQGGARRHRRRRCSLAERCVETSAEVAESLDRFVGENEAKVSVATGSPACHRGCSYLRSVEETL
jgi:hypothetical protein